MKIKNILSIILLVAMFATSPKSMALSTTHFATSSKLATGHWVKIRVSETGVHEITSSQLSEMGFSDPAKVKIFGQGGYALAEALTEDLPDDINQIPTLVHNGKVIFYANGSVKMTANTSNAIPYFLGDVNPYSCHGYYFLTDSDAYQAMSVEQVSGSSETTNRIEQCYDYVYHNNELYSFIHSGKTFYGEDLTKTTSFPFIMPNLVAGNDVMIALSLGGNVDANCTVSSTLSGQKVTLASSTLKKLTSNKKFEVLTTTGTATVSEASDSYDLTFAVTGTGINSARLDYYSVTYVKSNEIPADSAQTRIGLLKSETTDLVAIKNVTDDIIVWDVTNSQKPQQSQLTIDGTEATFSHEASTSAYNQFIAFYPNKTLKSVAIEGQIENQDLHAEETPDMVIIYTKDFKAQAEKLAQVHSEFDGFKVLTVEESKIFNEFSSGGKDANAYRLFLKMLFDRDSDKLKFLLLLGSGSYDNRAIFSQKSENLLLTYQSLDSNGSVSSYVTDDFFGFLKDSSGKSLPTDLLSISVGRIPAKTVEEAENAVNKTINYITNTAPEIWHSNALIISDEGDDDLHTLQAKSIEEVIDETNGAGTINIEKVYQEWYTTANISENANYGIENRARDKVESILKEGFLFGTYIGHATHEALQGYKLIWPDSKARTVKYPHLPFMSVASCETARYDDDNHCVCETMALTPEGGTIGVIAATRTVYSTQNDRLNQALVKQLYTLKSDGDYITIGEAYKNAKLSFGQSYNFNKLSFSLFGDPAVKVRFPINRCKITSINGTAGSQVTVSPLSTIKVTGIVCNDDSNIDSSFNGEVTLSIFNNKTLSKQVTVKNSDGTTTTHDLYYPREKICNVTGDVVNGMFTINITLPENSSTSGEAALIQAFASSDDNIMVAGASENLIIKDLDSITTIEDTEYPQISKITIDGQADDNNAVFVSANPTIYIEATDNMSINTKPNDVQGSMKAVLDNGKTSIPPLSNLLNAYDSGKRVKGSIQLHDLAAGKHTLKVSISDIAGNTTQKDVIFYVIEPDLECELEAASDVARESVELTLNTENDIHSATFRIYDATGNLVLIEETSGNTLTWNLKDASGTRVKAGRYSINASFNGNDGYGCSAPTRVIVLGN